MESAIRLRYCALPSAPLRLSYGAKGSADARASRFHLRFNHATLCLSHFSSNRPFARSFGHANCMLNRFSVPSKNEGSDNKILGGVTGVSLVLACVLELFNFSSKMNPKFNTAYALSPANAMSHKLPGGEAALESLLKMINAEEDSNLTPPRFERAEPSEAEVEVLKLRAVGLSKYGKHREALNLVENEYNKYEKHQAAKQYLGMALVELLIFQGKFVEARGWLDHQIDQQIKNDQQLLSADVDPKQLNNYRKKIDALLRLAESNTFMKVSIAKILLYKAIIHTMLENKEAAKWGEAFRQTLTGNV